MGRLNLPTPVVDHREAALMKHLAVDYQKFTTPGRVSKGFAEAWRRVSQIAPDKLATLLGAATDAAAEAKIVRKAMEYASRGFGELVKHSSRFTLSRDAVLRAIRQAGLEVAHFDHIPTLRSYKLEPIIQGRRGWSIAGAFAEGAATGAPGLFGVPFNIALSFFLYFRAVQDVALVYGYDVKNDPRELEIASQITLMSLAPTIGSGTETLALTERTRESAARDWARTQNNLAGIARVVRASLEQATPRQQTPTEG